LDLPVVEPLKKRIRISQTSRKLFESSSLAEQFALGRLLSSGNSDVYTAHDKITGRSVIIKIASIQSSSSSHLRLFREYMVLDNDLKECPHVPQVLSFVETSSNMFLVETPVGHALDDYLDNFNSAEVGKILAAWTVQLVQYLHAIHKCGIIHRDIKPQNIIVTPQTGELYFIDFDLAIVWATTSIYGFSGTKEFASANQLNGGTPCFGDDFESLCYTLYSLEKKNRLQAYTALYCRTEAI